MVRGAGWGVVSGVVCGVFLGCTPVGAGPPPSGTSTTSSSGSAGMDGGLPQSGTSGATTGSSRPPSSAGSPSSSGPPSACGAEGGDCLLPGNVYGLCCGGACVPRSENPNCGQCGRTCSNGETCAAGHCLTATCDTGEPYCLAADGGIRRCCGEACVDVQADHGNCGSCGRGCAASETCVSGDCVLSDCTVPGVAGAFCLRAGNRFGMCCGGVCEDTFGDPNHCGACGSQCPEGGQCTETGAACITVAGGPATCQADGGCGPGLACVGSLRCLQTTCAAGAEDAFACAVPGVTQHAGACCGGACTDPFNDDDHCGGCGRACGASAFCLNGTCAPRPVCSAANNGEACPLGAGGTGVCCHNTCVDTRNTAEHCGECGQACPTEGTCVNGACTTTDGGNSYCLQDQECPTGLLCVGGRCAREACGAGVSGVRCAFGGPMASLGGLGLCCGGECVDTRQDGDHCGACGVDCPSGGLCAGGLGAAQCLPEEAGNQCSGSCFGEGQVCTNGYCVAAACQGPFGQCSIQGRVGACCSGAGFQTSCVDLRTDERNCGACGAVCGAGQTCERGACSGVAEPCGEGSLGRFCGDAVDGGARSYCCASGCADLTSDHENCGWCGGACSAEQTCVQGRCVVVGCAGAPNNAACSEGGGYGQCCAEVCVDPQTDEDHCGQCGRRCPEAAVCQAGRCGVTQCTPDVAGSVCFGTDFTGRCCGTACVDTAADARHCSGCGLACAPGEACINGGCQ